MNDPKYMVAGLLLAGMLAQTPSPGGTVVLRIEATNPGESVRDVKIRSSLPQGIQPDDILSTAD